MIVMNTDLARVFRDMYLKHCADCAVGVPVPTPEEWVEVVDWCLQEAEEGDEESRE